MAGKQKIVVKLCLEDAKKRRRALKSAVGLPGVISAALDGEKIVVIGEIDSVELTLVLRKKMGYAELVSVGAAEEKKAEEKKKEEKKVEEKKPPVCPYQAWPPCPGQPPYQAWPPCHGQPVIVLDSCHYEPGCSFM